MKFIRIIILPHPISEDVIFSALIHLLLRICKLCSGLRKARPGRHHDHYRCDVRAQPEMETEALCTRRCCPRFGVRDRSVSDLLHVQDNDLRLLGK